MSRYVPSGGAAWWITPGERIFRCAERDALAPSTPALRTFSGAARAVRPLGKSAQILPFSRTGSKA